MVDQQNNSVSWYPHKHGQKQIMLTMVRFKIRFKFTTSNQLLEGRLTKVTLNKHKEALEQFSDDDGNSRSFGGLINKLRPLLPPL